MKSRRARTLSLFLVAAVASAGFSTSFADIAIYTVKNFQSIAMHANEPYQITGFVVGIHACPPKVVSAPCPGAYAIIADSPHKAGGPANEAELKLLLGPAGSQGLSERKKFLFTIKDLGLGPVPSLVHFKEFSEADVDDLTEEFKETVCVDDSNLFDCKPRIMKAIEDGDIDSVRRILRSGADVNTAYPYYYGKTALMHAIDKGEEEIALYLLDQNADPGVTIPLDPLREAEIKQLTRVIDKLRKLRERQSKH